MTENNISINQKVKFGVKMGDRGEIANFSIFGCKSAEMAITLAGILSEDQKMSVAKGI